jgi:hypothetical protein
MFLRKFIDGKEANIMIPKALKKKPGIKTLVKRVYKVLKSYQPHHWFDGFMDGIDIELNEMD